MPPASERPVIALLIHFAQLLPGEQKRFLDVLNAYLYASPQRRNRLRLDWAKAAGEPVMMCSEEQRGCSCAVCHQENGADGRRRD